MGAVFLFFKIIKRYTMNGKTVGLVAGISAAAFLGYCIYFDRKRRSAPDFKQKLREKRRNASKKGSSGSNSGPPLPDFSDQEAVQRFFLQEVQLGEQLLAQGDLEQGVEHLSLAVAVCGQPHSLLGVLQQTLPPQIYQLPLQGLDTAQRCEDARQLQHGGQHDGGPARGWT